MYDLDFLPPMRFASLKVGLRQTLPLVKKWHVAPLHFVPAFRALDVWCNRNQVSPLPILERIKLQIDSILFKVQDDNNQTQVTRNQSQLRTNKFKM